MRTFNYEKQGAKLLTPDIVGLLTQIHEFKGELSQFVEAKADTLTKLMEMAKIQSTEASNSIEGIHTSNERLKKIVRDKTTPRNRSEQEISGYRDVLATIHDSHEYIPPKPSMILQLHRDLYKFSGHNTGGSYKKLDNVIAEEAADGSKHIRFQPALAWETPEAMEALCKAYQDAICMQNIDTLLLIPMFILDFLCVHPFTDANGRMSRLLTLLLLYRADYVVGKYISIEKLIEESKETYYETLLQSSEGWHEEENDYAPFVRYLLGIIIAAYREFSSRVQLLLTNGLSKPDRVREVIKNTFGMVTKVELLQQCPDISQITVQRALNNLVKSGEIIKLSGGRYTSYIWNREND